MKAPFLASVTVLAAATLFVPTRAAAQSDWLTRPVERSRVLQIGATRNSSLDAGDGKLDDGSHYELWYVQGRAGQRVTVTMRSSDFDTYLAVGEHQGSNSESDDDSAGGTDSRVTLSVPASGVLVVRANSLSEGKTGAFSLEVTDGEGGSAASPHRGLGSSDVLNLPVDAARRLRLGQPVNSALDAEDGTISDNSYFEAWYIELSAGQTVTISLSSGDFDTYLHIGPHGSRETPTSNDDLEEGDTDSGLRFTAPTAGTYVVIANSYEAGETGNYTLRVDGQAGGGGVADVLAGGATGKGGPARTGNVLSYGQTVSGELSASDPKLDDDSHYDEYTFTGTAGDRIVITLRAPNFDAFVTLREMDGTVIEGNDDGEALGGSTDAQLVVTLSRSGSFKIYANSLGGGETGSYTLTLERSR